MHGPAHRIVSGLRSGRSLYGALLRKGKVSRGSVVCASCGWFDWVDRSKEFSTLPNRRTSALTGPSDNGGRTLIVVVTRSEFKAGVLMEYMIRTDRAALK